MNSIPLVDLAAQHVSIAHETNEAIQRVIDSSSFILGEEVSAFEEAFAAFSGVRHCIGVGNGTDALELSLRAAGIGLGNDVLLPANTFAATALAVIRAGARPVLCDIDPSTYLLDPTDARQRVSAESRAIIPVHLYGQMAPMEEIGEIARAAQLVVIEDAAQSQGARHHGVPSGSLGLAAGTSFYPAKNIGAYGDGGAVLSMSDEIAESVRGLRNYGGERKYYHNFVGFNSRLDSIQAAILRVKLKYLTHWNALRHDASVRYREMLKELPSVTLPQIGDGNDHVWHLFVIRVPERDRVVESMQSSGIGVGIHYPVPLHMQPAFAFLGQRRGDFPHAEKASDEVLSLPLYPEITEEQQARVVEALKLALGS